MPPPGAKRVFLTSKTYSGNLLAAGGQNDALSSADHLCQLAADAAQLGGSYTAWLSTGAVQAIDRIADVGPWYRLDGQQVFANKSAIVALGPTVPISIDELGADPVHSAWTGTLDTGLKDSFRCNDWTNDAQFNGYEGRIGIPSTITLNLWTEGSTNPCAGKNGLYCFEQ